MKRQTLHLRGAPPMDAEMIASAVGRRGQRQVVAGKRDVAHLGVADPVGIDRGEDAVAHLVARHLEAAGIGDHAERGRGALLGRGGVEVHAGHRLGHRLARDRCIDHGHVAVRRVHDLRGTRHVRRHAAVGAHDLAPALAPDAYQVFVFHGRFAPLLRPRYRSAGPPRKAIDPGCTRGVQGAEYRLWGWGVAVVCTDVRGRLAGAASAAMLLLAACTHDPYVNATNTTPSGEWRIERQIDRVTGAPISSVLLMTSRVSNGNAVFAPPAQMQLACFKEHPVVVIAFAFKIGSTRNAELGYRFDDKPGHEPRVRVVEDYKRVVIDDPNEVARFAGELATADGRRPLCAHPLDQHRAHQRGIQGRRRAGGDSGRLRWLSADGRNARERIAARRPPGRGRLITARVQEYFGSRSSSSIEMPCGPRRKQIFLPGRGECGSLVNSTPFFLRSAAMASMPETARPKWSSP